MADSIDRVFAHALQTVRKIPRSGSARPPAADRLKLYGLYKQSMEGDVEGVMERPSLLPPEEEGDLTREERAEVEKWDAWSACAGLTRSEAKCKYIDALILTMHTYAYGTPEARELVNELQFVWDQVKSNAAFATTPSSGDRDSSGKLTNTPPRSRHAGIDEILENSQSRPSRTKEGLRVLRPMSDQDEEEAREEDDDDANPDQTQPNNTEDENHLRRRNQPNSSSSSLSSWQARVDRALVQMTAEIAALREVVEARGRRLWGTAASRQSKSWLGWVFARIWALIQRVVTDGLVVALLFVVLRYRRDGAEGVVKLWIDARDRVRRKVRNVALGIAGAPG